jgi:hypothetical protein
LSIERHFALAIDRDWLLTASGHDKRLQQQLLPIGSRVNGLSSGCRVYVRLRRDDGRIQVELTRIEAIKDALFLKSEALCHYAVGLRETQKTLLLFFEGSSSVVRCIVVPAPAELWDAMQTLDPPLRPASFDLPPATVTPVDAEDIYDAIHELVAGGDAELFGANAQQFLTAPHIIVPLFAHVLSLSSSDNIDFPLLLRTTAEQLRSLLTDPELGPPRIKKIQRNHASLWADVLGDRIAFVDGGVARISGVATAEPLALRVGVYSVVPGESDLTQREDWKLTPFVIGDLVQPTEEVPESDSDGASNRAKRLQEAARYVLEPLASLAYVDSHPNLAFLFLHGPLINQFTVYNDGPPNYLPFLQPEFLRGFGLDEASISASVTDIPKTPRGALRWNQFMAVYGALMKKVFALPIPVAGVVERTGGQSLGRRLLEVMVNENRLTEAHSRQLRRVIDRFEILDDFLFGCVLEEGEYIEPIKLPKNPERRAVDDWAAVVRQYPDPHATVIKTSASTFPFRVEMNPAAMSASERTLRLLYHTARLLPRYAFPVGLDIVDKYAKVPNWLSRGVSGRIAAEVLRRALNTGDPKMVAQIRQFLARGPRDFFYRPQAS